VSLLWKETEGASAAWWRRRWWLLLLFSNVIYLLLRNCIYIMLSPFEYDSLWIFVILFDTIWFCMILFDSIWIQWYIIHCVSYYLSCLYIVLDGQRVTCISGLIVFARFFNIVLTICSHYFIDTSKGSFVSFIALAAKLLKPPLRNARCAVRKSLRRWCF
jgi:hypothetical protein